MDCHLCERTVVKPMGLANFRVGGNAWSHIKVTDLGLDRGRIKVSAALHNLVQRTPPVASVGAKPEAARFVINWLSAAGTGVFAAAILSGVFLRGLL
jgi:hypothetical protein